MNLPSKLQRNMQNFSRVINYEKPAKDISEVSLFGPGIGECIVVHLGDNKWFVIDSCRCPLTDKPIAIKYLEELGVEVSTQVEGVLITHWHKDHIDGAFDLISKCDNAQIYFSAALLQEEAIQLAKVYKKSPFTDTDKEIREFGEIIEYLRGRKDASRAHMVRANFTFCQRTTPLKIRLLALSPSSQAVTQSIANLAVRTPSLGGSRTRHVVRQSKNLNAVVLYFEFGFFSAIFGSDLEETGNQTTGWSAIISSGIQDNLSLEPAKLFKVPHHGSANAHNSCVWRLLLDNKPLAITTPYYGGRGLPTNQDIKRIQELASEFWLSRKTRPSKPPKRDRMVEREIDSVAQSRSAIKDKMGHIQVRADGRDSLDIQGNEHAVRCTV